MLKEEMEMRIAICDDEKIALEQTCNIVKDVFDEMHLKYFIDVYMDANELLQNKDQYDVEVHRAMLSIYIKQQN